MIKSEILRRIKVMITQLDVFIDYPYFKKYSKLVAIDLSKQQKLDADPKAIQQIKLTGNLAREEGSTLFFIIEEPKNSFRF